MQTVFHFLQVEDVCMARSVCKIWSTMRANWQVVKNGELREALRLADRSRVRELNLCSSDLADMHTAHKFAHVKKLTLIFSQVTDEMLLNLDFDLHSLNLCFCRRVTHATFAARKWPNLQCVNLGFTTMNDEALSFLPSSLVSLEATWSKFTDAGMVYVARLLNLETLGLRNCEVTDAGLSHLSKLRLRKLDLGCCPIKSLAWLSHMDLHYLSLEGSSVELVQFSFMKNLRELHLTSCVVTDGFKHLAHLSNLTSLNVQSSPVSDSDLIFVANLPALTILNLAFCQAVTEQGLAHLSHTKLQVLDLSNSSRVDDEGVEHLARIHTLKMLSLSDCGITDKCCVHLANLSLTVLELKNCDLTPAILPLLSSISTLVELHLHDVAQIGWMHLTTQRLRDIVCLD